MTSRENQHDLILTNFRAYLISRKFGSCISRVLIFGIRGKTWTKMYLISRFGMVNSNYKELTNENFYDCTKEVLAVLQANNKIETGEECWSKTSPERYIFQGFKVFRYSFFGTIPNFLNRLLDSLLLVRSTWNLQYLLVLDWTLAWFTFCKNRYSHDNEKQKSSKTVKLKFCTN